MHLKGLIAGLGNTGAEYGLARHNFGFMAVDRIVERSSCQRHMHLQSLHLRAHADLFEFCPEGPGHGYYLLAKPLTGMNQSGDAVVRILRRFELPPSRLLVLHDEMDLGLGRLGMARNRSANHHKGVFSIEQAVGTEEFLRIRLGIGRPPDEERIQQWVMERFDDRELAVVELVVQAAWRAVELMHRRDEADAEHMLRHFQAGPG